MQHAARLAVGAAVSAVAAIALADPPPAAAPPPATHTVSGKVIAVDNGKPAVRDEIYVYLERVYPRRDRAKAERPKPQTIRQENEQFSPHVLVVPVGTKVAFPNFDHEEHNVFSPTDPPGSFDLGRYNTDHTGKSRTFETAAEVEIYCDIHKQMWARVKVVDTDASLIAKVAADGKYAISGVTPGTYKLHAWTYDSEEVVQRIAIDAGDVTANELHVQIAKMRSETHLRKDGTRYGSKQYPDR